MSKPLIVHGNLFRPNLFIEIKKKKTNYIKQILDKLNDGESTIIYCKTRKETEKISNELKKYNKKPTIYHAGMSLIERNKIQHKFINNEVDIIVATIAFGMGINKSNIHTIIHYGVPDDLNNYYQEIGRAGRDDKNSFCYLLYTSNDFKIIRYFLSKNTDENQTQYKSQMISDIDNFLHTKICRHKFIVQYFSEQKSDLKCINKCDNCSNNIDSNVIVKSFNIDDYKSQIKKIMMLTNIVEPENLTKKIIFDILIGNHNISNILKIPGYFSILKNIEESYVNNILQYLLDKKIVKSTTDFKITKEGQKFLRKI